MLRLWEEEGRCEIWWCLDLIIKRTLAKEALRNWFLTQGTQTFVDMWPWANLFTFLFLCLYFWGIVKTVTPASHSWRQWCSSVASKWYQGFQMSSLISKFLFWRRKRKKKWRKPHTHIEFQEELQNILDVSKLTPPKDLLSQKPYVKSWAILKFAKHA